jgi:hypothetical protein
MENGTSNWQPDDGSGVWGFDTTYAHSGNTDLHGVDKSTSGLSSAEMSHSVSLPADGQSFLRFDHA